MAVLGTVAERSTEQLLRVDGSPVLSQGALFVAIQPLGSTSTGSYHPVQLHSQPPVLMSFLNPHLVSLATGRRTGMSFVFFLSFSPCCLIKVQFFQSRWLTSWKACSDHVTMLPYQLQYYRRNKMLLDLDYALWQSLLVVIKCVFRCCNTGTTDLYKMEPCLRLL